MCVCVCFFCGCKTWAMLALAGTQIKPEWLLDVAPSRYFDSQKISEKSSARSKLEKLGSNRRTSQGQGPEG